jgi:hypothetical protein
LSFLTDVQFNGNFFDIIGNQEWYYKGSHKSCFDQQPIEIGYLVEAYSEAFKLTNNKEYILLANKAFDWFFGNNTLGVPVYDIKNNYPLDGLSAQESNSNSGAESIISFSLALICLKELNKKRISEKINKKMLENK